MTWPGRSAPQSAVEARQPNYRRRPRRLASDPRLSGNQNLGTGRPGSARVIADRAAAKNGRAPDRGERPGRSAARSVCLSSRYVMRRPMPRPHASSAVAVWPRLGTCDARSSGCPTRSCRSQPRCRSRMSRSTLQCTTSGSRQWGRGSPCPALVRRAHRRRGAEATDSLIAGLDLERGVSLHGCGRPSQSKAQQAEIDWADRWCPGLDHGSWDNAVVHQQNGRLSISCCSFDRDNGSSLTLPSGQGTRAGAARTRSAVKPPKLS